MPLSAGAIVVFALIGVALVLFVTEWLQPDITALAVLVTLAVLSPLTGVPPRAAIAGFASPAVVTIIAMYILSAGIEATGVIQLFGSYLSSATGGDERRVLGATVASTGLSAGFINNTPIVAMFVPLVTDIAERYGLSPSKLLMPLSFAAMLGGTVTLLGTATNLLVSDLSRQLLAHPIGLFEFTPVGLLTLAVGLLYLCTVGYWLVPERIPPFADFTEEFDMDRHLAQVRVRERSPLVGLTVREALDRPDVVIDDPPVVPDEPLAADADFRAIVTAGQAIDVDVLQFQRDGEAFFATTTDRPVEAGDVLTVRGNRQAVNQFGETFGLRQLSRESVTEALLSTSGHPGVLVEAVLHPESRMAGRTIADVGLRARFDTTVLAIRRGDEFVHEGLAGHELETGDTLLLQAPPDAVRYLQEEGYLVLTEGPPELFATTAATPRPSLDPKAPVAVGLLVAAITVAALGLIPIYIAALGGVVGLVATRTLGRSRAYGSVNWGVVFLLAGMLPLERAMRETGGAAVLGDALGSVAVGLPPLAMLGAFYLCTAVLASVITPVATVVLLSPIAVDTAQTAGLPGFPFLLMLLFAASNAFLTPIGYQTNLIVYGPGGYRFTDFARVGAPLQALLLVVTTLGVAALWLPSALP